MRNKAVSAMMESWISLGCYAMAGWEYSHHEPVFGALFTVVGTFAAILMILLLNQIKD